MDVLKINDDYDDDDLTHYTVVTEKHVKQKQTNQISQATILACLFLANLVRYRPSANPSLSLVGC